MLAASRVLHIFQVSLVQNEIYADSTRGNMLTTTGGSVGRLHDKVRWHRSHSFKAKLCDLYGSHCRWQEISTTLWKPAKMNGNKTATSACGLKPEHSRCFSLEPTYCTNDSDLNHRVKITNINQSVALGLPKSGFVLWGR